MSLLWYKTHINAYGKLILKTEKEWQIMQLFESIYWNIDLYICYMEIWKSSFDMQMITESKLLWK